MSIMILEKINGLPIGFKKVHDDIRFFKENGTIVKDEDLTKQNKYSEFMDYVNENLIDVMEDDDFVIGKLLVDDIEQYIDIEKNILNNFIVYKTNMDSDVIQEYFDIMIPIYKSDEYDEEDKKFLEELSKKPINNKEWTKKVFERFEKEDDYEPYFNDDEIQGITVILDGETFNIENPKIKSFKNDIEGETGYAPDDIDIVKERQRYKDLVLNIDTVELTNNPKESLRRYLTAIINQVKETGMIDEDMLDDYRLNYSEFEKLGLDDVYFSAKGTKAENVIYYFLNLLREKKPTEKHILSKNDNKKINYLRKKFNFDTIFESTKKSLIGELLTEHFNLKIK